MSSIAVSLTTFTNFVQKSGPPRVTAVRDAVERYSLEYRPATDFWRPMRDGIISAHRSDDGLAQLDALPGRVSSRRRSLYVDAVNGYREFLRNKSVSFFPAASTIWSAHGLDVRVNPELGLHIDGVPYFVKLYLKKEPTLDRSSAQLILCMLGELPTDDGAIKPLVLDVIRGRGFSPNRYTASSSPLLAGEAAAFVAIWRTIDRSVA